MAAISATETARPMLRNFVRAGAVVTSPGLEDGVITGRRVPAIAVNTVCCCVSDAAMKEILGKDGITDEHVKIQKLGHKCLIRNTLDILTH